MADNTQLNPGVGGDLISTDDLGGGVKVQRVKVQFGTDGSAADVSSANPLPVAEAGGPSTGTCTSVAASATVVTLLAASASRLGATVHNDGPNNLYLRLGAGASLAAFSVRIPAQGYYEVPYRYTGVITGIWDVASGDARITELT